MKITNPKDGAVLDSKYNDTRSALKALAARLAAGEFNGNSNFAQSIYDATAKANGQTPGRLFWLHKLANEGAKRTEVPIKKGVDLTSIVTMLATAKANGLKYPAIVLTTPEKVEVKLSLANDKSKNAGAVYITSTAFRGPYYGKVMPEGDFHQGRDFIPSVTPLLEGLSKDPTGFAASQGFLTGRCCFCRKTLTDEKSTSVGYGPVCAHKFGLARGVKAKKSNSGLRAPAVKAEEPRRLVRVIKRKIESV